MISVIIPIYNVEKYLRKCIDSVISQTYKELEIILVDDGTPDSCGDICDEYVAKDQRVRVIHKENGGLSSARNAGIEIANGDYIGFVDSDDWIESSMYEKLLSLMVQGDCDITECAVNMASTNGISVVTKSNDEILAGKVALERHLRSSGDNYMPRVAVWPKLFKKEFWIDRRFPEGQIHEDYFITCQALYESKRVGLVHEGLYNHLTDNKTSIMNSKFGKRDLYRETQFLKMLDYLLKKEERELYSIVLNNYYELLLGLYWKCMINNMDEQQEFYQKISNSKDDIMMSQIPFKRKLEIKCLLLNRELYDYLRIMLSHIRS